MLIVLAFWSIYTAIPIPMLVINLLLLSSYMHEQKAFIRGSITQFFVFKFINIINGSAADISIHQNPPSIHTTISACINVLL